jgi:hypothetical protein
MDAMKENEVIRNEALLLLVELTKGNEELQKLVAFEGAFERAFSVMREEGGVDGGIVVQDCLELCNNLLRDNPSNQTLFRENGFVKSVPGLAAVEREIGGSGMSGMSAQKAANTLCALETVHLLVSPDEDRGKRKHLQGDGDLSAMLKNQRLEGCKLNQSELAKHGMVEILVRASLGRYGGERRQRSRGGTACSRISGTKPCTESDGIVQRHGGSCWYDYRACFVDVRTRSPVQQVKRGAPRGNHGLGLVDAW